MELSYKIRGHEINEGSVQGKERVYFTCHPDDFEEYFDEISEDIFKTQNCAIYFSADRSDNRDDKDIDIDLGRMQLMVIPITARFLYRANKARDVDFQFAREHHIPILPLMQEPGLEEEFNRICGDIQFLDKHKTDMTAIPYEQKLEKYLKSVLLGDELAAKVRAAFDAYIFLSYRKKDRKYAQELMRLIHKNDFCRDIAIWYDEFLTPGENFNTAISEALEKSQLFAMVVTPNLVNENNYVMTTEYPAARDAKKVILPAEMAKTDREALQQRYEHIPETVNALSEDELGSALSASFTEQLKKIAIAENDEDMVHLFLIGLAYLGGIDVEVDSERAVALITKAAENGLPEAMEKLVAMYRGGDGVERNYKTAIEWQEKLVAYWKTVFEEEETERNYRDLVIEILTLGDYYYELMNLSKAKEVYKKRLRLANDYANKWDTRRGLLVIYNKLGDIAKDEGDIAIAKEYYEKALAISESMAKEMGIGGELRDLSVSYCKLCDIAISDGNLTLAGEYCEKWLAISGFLAKETGTVEARRDLSLSYCRLGDIVRDEGNLALAKECYEKVLAISESLTEETETVKARRDLSVSYERLGDIAEAEGNLALAKEYYEKMIVILESPAKETETVKARRDLSVGYGRLADIAKAEGNLALAKEYYEKRLVIRESLAKEIGTEEARSDLAISYDRLGDIAESEELYNIAKEYYEKGLVIKESLAKEIGTEEARRDLAISYDRLGDIAESEELYNIAKEYYEKGLAISQSLAREIGTSKSYDDLAVFLCKLGVVNCTLDLETEGREMLTMATDIWTQLAETAPQMPIYAQRRDAAAELLAELDS